MAKKSIRFKVNRSSKTGRFVTKKFAKKHKATTQTETVKRKPKPGENNVSVHGSGAFDDN